MEDFHSQWLPKSSNTQSAYNLRSFQTYSTLPSAYGDMISQTVGSPGFTWVASPLSTELEIGVMDALATRLHLPAKFLFANQGLGIINFCLTDGLLAPILTSTHATLMADPPPTSPFVVYLSPAPESPFTQRIL